LGELFVRGQMFKTVMNTVDTFMQIHDAHSLECLCVLLIIIGPKLEKVKLTIIYNTATGCFRWILPFYAKRVWVFLV
jgi:hypothetical protein